MDIRTDRRGQTIQVGAVLLFGVAIVLFSTYQATIVPNQNSQTEFQHNQDVHSQLVTIRNTIATPPPRDESKGVQIDLGTTYSSRTIGMNPSNPSGSLQTVGTGNTDIDVTIKNAKTVQGTPGYWSGTTEFNTGGLVYKPEYNEYQADKVVYDNQALYVGDSESGTGTLTEPSMIRGRSINLVTLTGSLAKSSSGTETFDVKTVDRSQESIKLTNEGSDPLEIQFQSRQPASYWQRLGEGNKGGYIKENGITDDGGSDDGWYEITVELQEDVTYDVTLTEVGVGEEGNDRKKDGTKMSMAAVDNVYRTGFKEWTNNMGPTDQCDHRPAGNADIPAFETNMIGGVCRLANGQNVDGVEGYRRTNRTYYLPAGTYEVGFTVYIFMAWDGGDDDSARAYVNPQDENDLLWEGVYSETQTPVKEEVTTTYDFDEGGTFKLQFKSDGLVAADSEAWGINDVWIRHAGEG